MTKIIKGNDLEKELGPTKAIDCVGPSGGTGLDRLGSVLKKGVFEAESQAVRLLAEASVEAHKVQERVGQILAQAERDYESEKKRGYEEGHQEGLAQVTETLARAEATHEKLLSQSEGEIVTLVNAIVGKILGREVAKGAVVGVVRQAISQIIGEKIVVRVNPEDLRFLRAKEGELMGLLDKTQSLSFREDPLIAAGGCVVDSETGTVDAQLPNQIAAIKKALGL
ncbi:MAG: hypothetical protein HYS22_08400 [Deltaproteobacteria bacterium]|nr:hypothetical protein [Deltaproteobacteria bacterium]